MRYKLISCEVFYREMTAAVSRSPHIVDLEFLPKGLHDLGAKRMRERLQVALDSVPAEIYDATLLGYGLCNNGLVGLMAQEVPLVVPRAHDCITLFLGSRERYLRYFHAHPGVYFKTTGWIERGSSPRDANQLSIPQQTGTNRRLEEFIAKYGEDNGRYLYEMLGDDKHNYRQFTFIEMGVEPNDSYEVRVQEEAQQRGWAYEKIPGDLSLIQRMVDGEWESSEFLIVPPDHRIVAHYDEGIIAAERADGG